MIEFYLPFPPHQLSPNKRLHWAKVAKVKSNYRRECWASVLEQLGTRPGSPGDRLHLYMEFMPPDRRSYDRDNLIARMKSGLDGVADAFCIDDKVFTILTAKVGATQKGGTVRVIIKKESENEFVNC